MPTETQPKELSQSQNDDAEDRTSVKAKDIHEAIRRDGEEELSRSASALIWSGLAAGLAMGLSLLAEGVIRHHLPDVPWRPLVAKLGYPLGFLVVIIGKQQLFTENTLTPIIPAMHNRDVETVLKVARLWALVLAANLLGCFLVAWFFASTPVLRPELQHSLLESAQEATAAAGGVAFVKGIVAGWLIALVVWLRAAVETGEVFIIVVLTYFISAGEFTHVVAGSVEHLYRVMAGKSDLISFAWSYLLPVLAGNIVGGVAIVAALNHGQVAADEE